MIGASVWRLSSSLFVCAAMLALVPGSAAAAGCPNEAFRVGFSAGLPECRAYEKVSPDDKGGFSAARRDGGIYTAASNRWGSFTLGDGVLKYTSGGPFDEPESSSAFGVPYLYQRGAGGWTAQPIAPPAVPPATLIGPSTALAVSADGRYSVSSTSAKLLPSAPETENIYSGNPLLYLRDNLTHRYQLITRKPLEGSIGGEASLVEATPDLHKLVFATAAVLVPGATSGVENLYEWVNDGTELGQLSLVGYRPEPEGTVPFPGAGPAQPASENGADNRRTMSADGHRVFFSAEEGLWARIDGARTVEVSASQRQTPDPAGPQPAIYLTADEVHGSVVFFASGEKLTDDSEAAPGEADLYRYSFADGRLTDLTAGSGPAAVQGVVGAATDASTVYFSAKAALIPGQGVAGEPNLYYWHDDGTAKGELRFVATAPETEVGDPEGVGPYQGANTRSPLNGLGGRNPLQVSPDGRWMAFVSTLPVSGYPTGGKVEIFRYDGLTGQILCASCDPDAPASTSLSELGLVGRVDAPRVVSENGLVAFRTKQALSPADTNGQYDVYVFDGIRPRLISGGQSPELSSFLGLTADGTDIYFGTSQQLLPGDQDDLVDIYDARVDGGFAEPAPAVPCAGSACRGTGSTVPGSAPPASAGLTGSGNLDTRCDAPRSRAARLRARAKELGRLTKRLDGRAARRLGAAAKKAKTKAKRARRQAKTCTRNNRRAGA